MAVLEAAACEDELGAVLNKRDELANSAVTEGRAAAVAARCGGHQPRREACERIDVETRLAEQARIGAGGVGGKVVSLP